MQLAAERAEMGWRERVQCAIGSMGSNTLGAGGSTGSDCTFGWSTGNDGSSTLGDGAMARFMGKEMRTVLLVGSVIGAGVGRLTIGGVTDGAGGCTVATGIQLVNSSRSLEMAVSCS